MSERPDVIKRFLTQGGWAGWTRTALPADASQRRYERLSGPNGQSLVLMISPKDQDAALRSFLAIGAHLRGLGLAAPEVLREAPDDGLLMLEDLGRDTFASWIGENADEETALYLAATEVILTYTAAEPPPGLTYLDPKLAGDMIALYPEWAADGASDTAARRLGEVMAETYDRLAAGARALSLRDFHAENLIWHPMLSGSRRVGLLDFQDAFLAPATYDLASLLRDPRRAVGAGTQAACLARFAERTGRDMAGIGAELACVAAQRNLRIAGIFHRLIRRDGKPRYAMFLPHLKQLLAQDLSHPALSALRAAVDACGAMR